MSALRKCAVALLVCLLVSRVASAQISVPNTLVAGTTIKAGDLNTNFSTIANHALDRLAGGTISGNVTLDPGITIDGIDLSVALCSTCAATFGSVTVNGVGIVNASGKIPAITSTYFTSLAYDAANLTGTVAVARLGTGSPSSATYLRGDGSWASFTAQTTPKSTTYIAAANDFVLATGTFTVTLPAAAANANQIIDVKNISTGVITVAGNASELIDAANTFVLSAQYQSVTLISNGTQWYVR